MSMTTKQTELWVIAHEHGMNESDHGLKGIGYSLLQGSISFPSYEKAIAHIKELKLPIGWIVIEASRLIPDIAPLLSTIAQQGEALEAAKREIVSLSEQLDYTKKGITEWRDLALNPDKAKAFIELNAALISQKAEG